MKASIIGVTAFVGGLILFIGISAIFEYVSVQNALAFALRNGIYQVSKQAMIPEIVCELVENPEFDPLVEDEDIPEFIEECVEVFLTTEEYFYELHAAVGDYKQGRFQTKLELLAYEPKPFLARARLVGSIRSSFWDTKVEVEEMVIAH